jgi:uncharacterized protein YndB with AHSA1/START domain
VIARLACTLTTQTLRVKTNDAVLASDRSSWRCVFKDLFTLLPCKHLKGAATMPTHTITLHRVLRAPAERIYRAFLDADAMSKWLPPHGFTAKVHHMDTRVGGNFKMSFTNFSTGHTHAFGGEYVELTPHERLVYTDVFDDPNLPGVMQVTVTLKQVAVGTDVHIVQEGVPEVIPAEACYLGWQESLTLLGLLVEAEIKG